MMDRRTFLSVAGSAAAAALLGGGGRARAQSCASFLAGAQLFTLRAELSEPRSVLASLAALGIEEVELFGLGPSGDRLFGRPDAELRALLDDAGIRAPFAHIDDEFGKAAAVAAIAERAHTLGVTTVVLALPSELTASRDGRFRMARPDSMAEIEGIAARLDRAGRAFRDAGLRFAYHNHHVEFMPPPDAPAVVPFDYIMARTDPELVEIELDLAWLAAADREPVEYLERYRGRVVACHLKDLRDPVPVDEPAAALVEPGGGSIDFAAVLAAMRAGGVRHGFIEIDVTPEPLAAIERGLRHLQSLC